MLAPLFALGLLLGPAAAQASRPATLPASRPDLHGRLEARPEGLRILRLWGTAEERGFAHGFLMAEEILLLLRDEVRKRFPRPQLLAGIRRNLERIVVYPEPIQREIAALFRGIQARGLDLQLPGMGRDVDETDLRLVNALDVAAFLGCSGFTVWGPQSEDGSVLFARNFDWPFSGPSFLTLALLIVQHPSEGAAFATVSWPGYVGAVTGMSAAGVGVALHTGNRFGLAKPETLPCALAARRILEEATPATLRKVAEAALDGVAPPTSMLIRVVGALVDGQAPELVFEADTTRVRLYQDKERSVSTNHFRAEGQQGLSIPDSQRRFDRICRSLDECLQLGDRKVGPLECWDALAAVAVGRSGFGTLHSVLFSPEPLRLWIAFAAVDQKGRILPAPKQKRHLLTGAELFDLVR